MKIKFFKKTRDTNKSTHKIRNKIKNKITKQNKNKNTLPFLYEMIVLDTIFLIVFLLIELITVAAVIFNWWDIQNHAVLAFIVIVIYTYGSIYFFKSRAKRIMRVRNGDYETTSHSLHGTTIVHDSTPGITHSGAGRDINVIEIAHNFTTGRSTVVNTYHSEENK